MFKSRFSIVALGTIAAVLTFSIQPAQARLTVGAVLASTHVGAVPMMQSPMVVDPDRLFRYEQPVLWAGESNGIRDCIYNGKCGMIAVDAQHGCG